MSHAEAETVVKRLGGSIERIRVVPPGVDGALFHPAATPPLAGSSTGLGYALVAGRLQPLKGLDLAIEAIAAVPAAIRPELVVAGDASADFDHYIGELRSLAARLGIARGVRFVGPQPRASLAALMRQARLVLVPSHSETYGLVALEAAASGVPVVAAASGGLPEAVVDGVTGVIVSSREPQQWAGAVVGILSSPELERRLGRSARERAERFDWARSGERLLAVYAELLRGGARTGAGPEAPTA